MNQTLLHYLYDPLCGWCYGAAPLLALLHQRPGLKIELHAGGLWVGARRQVMGTALRNTLRPHDERIATLTGQCFGECYFNELLVNPDNTLDSEPPIRAILAVEASGGDGLQMLTRLQQSHYRDGVWLGDLHRLAALAAEQGVDANTFTQHYHAVALTSHLAQSQQWLTRLGSHGYPTLALERQGELLLLPTTEFLGNPDGFLQQLESLLATGKQTGFGM